MKSEGIMKRKSTGFGKCTAEKGYILPDKNNFRKYTEQLTHSLAFCEMWALEKYVNLN